MAICGSLSFWKFVDQALRILRVVVNNSCKVSGVVWVVVVKPFLNKLRMVMVTCKIDLPNESPPLLCDHSASHAQDLINGIFVKSHELIAATYPSGKAGFNSSPSQGFPTALFFFCQRIIVDTLPWKSKVDLFNFGGTRKPSLTAYPIHRHLLEPQALDRRVRKCSYQPDLWVLRLIPQGMSQSS